MQKKKRKPGDFEPSQTDPQGSWTGQPEDPDDVPVQDQDDL